MKGTVGVDKPTETSGSDTYPLDVAAALSEDRKSLTVAVVNPTESVQNISVRFSGVTLEGKGIKREVAAGDLQARNVAGQEPRVKIVESPLERVPERLEVAPLSVSVYEFKTR